MSAYILYTEQHDAVFDYEDVFGGEHSYMDTSCSKICDTNSFLVVHSERLSVVECISVSKGGTLASEAL